MRSIAACAISILFCALSVRADTLSLGFPEFDKSMNVLSSDHPAAAVVRRAVLARLTTTPRGDGVRLLLSDSMSISADRKRWSFRISPLARFSDGKAVLGSDAEFSLRRCMQAGMFRGIEDVSAEVAVMSGRTSQWVHVQLIEPSKNGAELSAQLSTCPILERRSSKIFGKDLGIGTNVVSAGEYAFADYKAGREIALRRLRPNQSHAGTAGADVITLRSFKDSGAALAALRAGTIDAFLSEDQPVIERAKKDETLLALQCPIYTVILRKGLHISCPEEIIASEIRYLS